MASSDVTVAACKAEELLLRWLGMMEVRRWLEPQLAAVTHGKPREPIVGVPFAPSASAEAISSPAGNRASVDRLPSPPLGSPQGLRALRLKSPDHESSPSSSNGTRRNRRSPLASSPTGAVANAGEQEASPARAVATTTASPLRPHDEEFMAINSASIASPAAVTTKVADLRARIPNLLDSSYSRARARVGYDREVVQRAAARFWDSDRNRGGQLGAEGCGVVLHAAGLPRYLAGALLHSAGAASVDDMVSTASVREVWRFLESAPTLEHAIVALLSRSGDFKEELDHTMLRPLVEHVLLCHPGLSFLLTGNDADLFGPRYVDAVLAQILHAAHRIGGESLRAADLQRIGLVDTLWELQECSDVNSISRFWSYEYFYVIYTTFWKLDIEHKQQLDRIDFAAYDQHGLTPLAADRIFECALAQKGQNTMSYFDFAIFMLNEEDKDTPAALRLWFRCLDLDGNGLLSPTELRQWHASLSSHLEQIGIEVMDFQDFLCQFLDIVRPSAPPDITYQDFRRCKLAHRAISMLTNTTKYLTSDEHNSCSGNDDSDLKSRSRWASFAAQRYEDLSLEDEVEANFADANDTSY